MYVIGKDMAQNCLIVSDNLGLERKEFFVKGINWISGDVPGKNFKATVKIRYRTPDTLADVMRVNGTSASVVFKEPVRSITPGQAAVFYQSDNVLGGGIIDVDFDPK
jgi:tRNA-specific 2-thiouridylase